jgi:hypothetical protein
VASVEFQESIRLAALHYIRVNKKTGRDLALKCGLGYNNLSEFLKYGGKIKGDTIDALMEGMEIDKKSIHDNLFTQIDEKVRRRRV